MHVNVNSEIGWLETVIVHRPGAEVELMSPQAAQEALHDDIIYLARATREHDQLAATLRQFATVYELCDLLSETLDNPTARAELIEGLCQRFACSTLIEPLLDLPSAALAERLLVGTPLPNVCPLQTSDYALPPMYNFYFTRDATMCVNDRLIIGAMASLTRWAEALVMRAIFSYHPRLSGAGFYLDGSAPHAPDLTVEGGDVLVLREDLLLVGQGERTSPAGIRALLEQLAMVGTVRHVVVQPIPVQRASIHLDMVFTQLDHDLCLIHEPAIAGAQAMPALHFELDAGRPPRSERHPRLLDLLAELGLPLTPVLTGGNYPLWQMREQWQRGANFFTMAPGKIVGYGHNDHTYRELAGHGFRVVAGSDVAAGLVDLTGPGRVAVAMDAAELARGGGGCRCMTLPVCRKA